MAGPNVEMANAECTENDVTESAIRPTLTQNGIRLPTAKDVDARRRAQRKRCVSVFEEGSSYKRMAVAAALQKVRRQELWLFALLQTLLHHLCQVLRAA